jgi:hypothetical protein
MRKEHAMTGGTSPRRKGFNFERKLVEMAKQSGIQATRAWGSNGAAIQCHPSVDLLIAGHKLQAKRKHAIPAWLCLNEHVDGVVVREDRGEAVVVLRYADWLDLVKEK